MEKLSARGRHVRRYRRGMRQGKTLLLRKTHTMSSAKFMRSTSPAQTLARTMLDGRSLVYRLIALLKTTKCRSTSVSERHRTKMAYLDIQRMQNTLNILMVMTLTVSGKILPGLWGQHVCNTKSNQASTTSANRNKKQFPLSIVERERKQASVESTSI
jgi:hypothetical protein